MKRISQLVFSLLLINVSCVMGMDLKKREDFLSTMLNESIEKRDQKVHSELRRLLNKKEKSNKELEKILRASAESIVSACSLLPIFDPSLQYHTQAIVGQNSIGVFQALSTLQLTGSCYELWNATQTSSHATSKKNRRFLAASFFVSAIPWACASMIDSCPPEAPYCIRAREFFCLLNLLVAGCAFYEAYD